MGYIYKITNDVNDKVYIGQTTLSIEARFKRHLYNTNLDIKTKLYDAIRSFGAEHFKILLIEEVSDNLLDEKEIYWIEQYDSYYNGYNSTLGGSGNKRLTQDIATQILLLRSNDKTIQEIAKELKCSHDTVVDVLRRNNLSTAHSKDKMICELKESGYKTTEIASMLKCGTTTVVRVLQDLRPDLLTINQRKQNQQKALELRKKGYTLQQIADELKISRKTIGKYVANV